MRSLRSMNIAHVVFAALTLSTLGAACAPEGDVDPTGEATEAVSTCETSSDTYLANPIAALPSYGPGIAKPFVWPLSNGTSADWLSGGFTPRWKVSAGRYDFHQGLDIVPRVTVNGVAQAMSQSTIKAAPPAIHVAAAGVVANIYDTGSTQFPTAGKVVQVRHYLSGTSNAASNVYYTYYLHLSDFCTTQQGAVEQGIDESQCATRLAVGQTLAQGAILGHVGAEDLTDPGAFWHLHFEVRSHGYQFYAVNPLRYLPDVPNNDGYQPQIRLADALPGSCSGTFDPLQPRFWVHYRTDRDELDVNKILVTVRAADGTVLGTREVDYERRRAVGCFHDEGGTSADGILTGSTEYDPDALPFQVTPIFGQCRPGTGLIDVFQSTSPEFAMDVQFDGLPGASAITIDAQVCDIYGTCESAPRVAWPQ